MTALAIDVLREVSEAGGTVRLEGDMLRLSAPEPLPDELRARLRQHKAEIVALLCQLSRPTTRRLKARPCRPSPACRRRSLTAFMPCSRLIALGGYRRSAGRRCSAMLRAWSKAGWAQQALALGWTTADLFGCDQRAPWYRLDRCRARPADRRARGRRADRRRRRAPDIDRIGAALPAPAAGAAAVGAAVGAADSRPGDRAPDPRPDGSSE